MVSGTFLKLETAKSSSHKIRDLSPIDVKIVGKPPKVFGRPVLRLGHTSECCPPYTFFLVSVERRISKPKVEP